MDAEKIESVRQRIKDLEPEIMEIVESLREDPQNVSIRWEYLHERRVKTAGRLRRDFLNTKEELNYILNVCGPNVDILKKEGDEELEKYRKTD